MRPMLPLAILLSLTVTAAAEAASTRSSGGGQTANIGSQSTGIGAGKATFNPFSVPASRPLGAAQLNIGSQSTGAGAGRITFNPCSISRRR